MNALVCSALWQFELRAQRISLEDHVDQIRMEVFNLWKAEAYRPKPRVAQIQHQAPIKLDGPLGCGRVYLRGALMISGSASGTAGSIGLLVSAKTRLSRSTASAGGASPLVVQCAKSVPLALVIST
jgi:hypothetical protein